MGYTFTCDVCETPYERTPVFMGELRESFVKTSPSPLAQIFTPGETATLCQDCTETLFLAGKIAQCRRCGFTTAAANLPANTDECPECEGEHFPEIFPRDTDD